MRVATDRVACDECGAEIARPSHHQRYCSDRCRYRARDQGRSLRPAQAARVREASRRWAQKHRGCKRPNLWLRGQPIYEPYLPGVVVGMRISEGFSVAASCAVHGLVTTLIGERHDPAAPGFALGPWGEGWAVWLRDTEQARKLRAARRGKLRSEPVEVVFGPPMRVKSPRVTRRGHRLVTIEALTPVVVRSNAKRVRTHHTMPTTDNLTHTLSQTLARRLDMTDDDLSLELRVTHRETWPETHYTGKLGQVRGWVGRVTVDTNATGEWLLRCAEVLGLGGRVGYGCGRIRVTS